MINQGAGDALLLLKHGTDALSGRRLSILSMKLSARRKPMRKPFISVRIYGMMKATLLLTANTWEFYLAKIK